MPIIETRNLSYIYGKGTACQRTAVDNLSIKIEQGELVSVIGHTGSGKSTLVQLLNGLLKPSGGSVFVDGVDIWSKPKEIRKIRFKVGLVFQYPEYQLFEETVYKDISFGPKNMGLSESEIQARVLSAADFVGLKRELLQKSPFELSGGEKRRAAIAGVMAMEPQVLILDEPSAGLDPQGRRLLLDRICEYKNARNITVILVSHSMEDTARISDKILVMSNGRPEIYDTPKNVFAQSEKLRKISLSVPQITHIMQEIKSRGYDVSDDILTVEEAYLEIRRLLNSQQDT